MKTKTIFLMLGAIFLFSMYQMKKNAAASTSSGLKGYHNVTDSNYDSWYQTNLQSGWSPNTW